jgi:hypothetical protein
LVLNGGNMQLAAPLLNPVRMISDTFSFTNGATSGSVRRGNIDLSPGGVGGTRTISTGGNIDTTFQGVVSGAVGTNLIKTGSNGLMLNGLNTYLGTTTVTTTNNSGLLYLGTSVRPNEAGALGISDTPLLVTGNGAVVGLAGQITMARDMIFTASATLRGQSVYNAAVTGGINLGTGVTLTVDNAASGGGAGLFAGGVLDLGGPISGAGALRFSVGQAIANVTPLYGTVRLSGNVNGISTNTFSGGMTFQQSRVQIGADSAFIGPATNPSAILSGPFGTGAIQLGAGGNGDQGVFEAYGADRVIVNPLNSINWNSNSTTYFGGHYNLTLASALNLQSEGSGVRNRTFQIDTTQGGVTMAGTLSNSVAGNFVKSGRGTLVLSGVNTQVNTNSGDGNYGRSLFIDAGMVSVSADANLGRTTVMGGSQSHIANLPGDILLRGGVLRVDGSFATIRQFQITTASGIDVTAGNTFTINPLTGGTTTASLSGAFALTKTGNGVLALNPLTSGTLNNTNSGLAIGGAPLATAAAIAAWSARRRSRRNQTITGAVICFQLQWERTY